MRDTGKDSLHLWTCASPVSSLGGKQLATGADSAFSRFFVNISCNRGGGLYPRQSHGCQLRGKSSQNTGVGPRRPHQQRLPLVWPGAGLAIGHLQTPLGDFNVPAKMGAAVLVGMASSALCYFQGYSKVIQLYMHIYSSDSFLL